MKLFSRVIMSLVLFFLTQITFATPLLSAQDFDLGIPLRDTKGKQFQWHVNTDSKGNVYYSNKDEDKDEFHKGNAIDFGAKDISTKENFSDPHQVEVVASAPGKIIAAGPQFYGPKGSEVYVGDIVKIEHENGVTTTYLHIKIDEKLLAEFKANQLANQPTKVEAGELLGVIASKNGIKESDFWTGPHLHFEINRGKYRGEITLGGRKIDDYKAGKWYASVKDEETWILNIFNQYLKREPNGEEKTKYMKLLHEGKTATDIIDDMRKSKQYANEREQVIERLRKEVEEAKNELKKAQRAERFWERVKTEAIKLAGDTALHFLGVKVPVFGLFWPETALAPSFDSSDASQLAQRTAQQLLTPVNITFSQTFDGFFTQAADFPGSQGGNHSGTTTGTRTGTGSRPGNWTTGSFSGRSQAEPGFTPVTHNNTPFSGTSVGTATARGFQEGDLKGSMTITISTDTQTVTVSGNITIKTDGSLSMPSYSGPVIDNETGAKVGTLTGSWSQGPTQ